MRLIELFEAASGELAPGQRILHPELAIPPDIWDVKTLIDTEQVKQMISILDTECSDFISVVKQRPDYKFLYRGVNSEESVFEARSRVDRKPRDSDEKAQQKFNELLGKCGISTNRSNSIFTTTITGFASNYGNLYYIFPKNGFKFLWTNRRDIIIDALFDLVNIDVITKFLEDFKAWVKENIPNPSQELLNVLHTYYTKSGWTELKMYWLVNNDPSRGGHNIPDQWKPDINKFFTVENFKNNFDPRTTDLSDAMKSGHEILISGEYWALRRLDWLGVLTHIYATSD